MLRNGQRHLNGRPRLLVKGEGQLWGGGQIRRKGAKSGGGGIHDSLHPLKAENASEKTKKEHVEFKPKKLDSVIMQKNNTRSLSHGYENLLLPVCKRRICTIGTLSNYGIIYYLFFLER